MSDSEILARLKEMQEDYDKAPVGGFADKLAGIEDGDYQGRVESWEMFPGKKNPDALYIKMLASIQHDPELNGREVEFFFEITDPEKLGFLKDHFYNLGVSELDMTQLAPGSDLLNSLLDVPVLIGIYTNKKGYRNAVIRQRLDGEVQSDLGTAQEQIAGFDKGEGTGIQTGPQAMATAERMQQSAKPKDCICKDPANGDFDDKCPIAGHGIGF